jgi:hypothetical protein
MAGADVEVTFEGYTYPCYVKVPLKALVFLREAFTQLVPPERKHVISHYALQSEGAVVDPYEVITGSERKFVLYFKGSAAVSHVHDVDNLASRLGSTSLDASPRTGRLAVITALPTPAAGFSHADPHPASLPSAAPAPAVHTATEGVPNAPASEPRTFLGTKRERQFARVAHVKDLLGFDENTTTMGISVRNSTKHQSAIACVLATQLLREFIPNTPTITAPLTELLNRIVDSSTGLCRLQLPCLPWRTKEFARRLILCVTWSSRLYLRWL